MEVPDDPVPDESLILVLVSCLLTRSSPGFSLVCVYMSAELCGIHFHKNYSSMVTFSDPVSPQFLSLGANLQKQLPCASVYNWGKH